MRYQINTFLLLLLGAWAAYDTTDAEHLSTTISSTEKRSTFTNTNADEVTKKETGHDNSSQQTFLVSPVSAKAITQENQSEEEMYSGRNSKARTLTSTVEPEFPGRTKIAFEDFNATTNFPDVTYYINNGNEHEANSQNAHFLVLDEYDDSTDKNNFDDGHIVGLGTELPDDFPSAPRGFSQPILNNFISFNLFNDLKEKEQKCGDYQQTAEGCSCDPDCRKYGDCCPNSRHFHSTEQKLGSSPFECTRTSSGGIFALSSCPSEWTDPVVRSKCEHPDKNYGDPMRFTLVSSLLTEITYRNTHCAVCHNDFSHDYVVLWPLSLTCNFNPDILHEQENPVDRMVYVSENSTWYLNLTGAYARASFFNLEECPNEEKLTQTDDEYATFRYLVRFEVPSHTFTNVPLIKCLITPKLPAPILIGKVARRCFISISECAENWQNVSVKRQCEAYYAPVKLCSKMYRNHHCVACNNWDSTVKVECFHQETFIKELKYTINWTYFKNPCGQQTFYDPFSQRCRPVFDPEENQPGSVHKATSNSGVTLKPEEYALSLDHSTVFVPAHNRLYHQHEFTLQDQLLILHQLQIPEGQHVPNLDYISIFSVSISIILLLLHVIVSFVVPEPTNLEKNVISFCLSLLLLYFSFIVSGSVALGTTPCIISALLLYYALLVSCFWMLIIPFDVFREIKHAMFVNQDPGESGWKTFHLYSASSWLIPTIVVGLAWAVDLDPVSSSGPGYGQPICWFSRSNLMIKFCLLPLVFILVLKTVLTSWSACLIRKHDDINSKLYEEFRFSSRLVAIVNLTWIAAITASYVQTRGAWHIFIFLHALQAIYIFGASSLTRLRKKLMIQ